MVAIDALGRAVDADCASGDVRLTMGGEPTFVSIDDMDGPEWNIAAVGPEQTAAIRSSLIRRLHERFAPGGLLHFGQGKWYPGEQLPRWALGLLLAQGWPSDLAQSELDRRRRRKTIGFTIADAERFVELLAERLEVDPGYAVPAFEDPMSLPAREGQLPINVDPADSKLNDAEERTRLAAGLRARTERAGGLCAAVAARLAGGETVWESGLWMLRGKHLVLMPGRFADRPAAAGGEPALGGGDRVSVFASARPIHARVPTARPAAISAAGRKAGQSWALGKDRREPGRAAVATRSHARDRRVGALGRADRVVRRAARRPTARVSAAVTADRRLSGAGRRDRRYRRRAGNARDRGRRAAAVRPARGSAQGDSRSRRDRSQRATGSRLAGIDGNRGRSVRRCAAEPAGDRKIHARWPSLGHRGRQSRGAGRTDAARQSVFAAARFAPLAGGLLAQSSVAELLVQRAVCRPDEPSAAGRRGPPRRGLRVGDRLRGDRSPGSRRIYTCRLGSSIACFAICWSILTGNTHRAEFCIDKLYSPDYVDRPLGAGRVSSVRDAAAPPDEPDPATAVADDGGLVLEEPCRGRPIRWGTQLHDRFLLPHFAWHTLFFISE